MNFVTPEKIAAASRFVRRGEIFSLALSLAPRLRPRPYGAVGRSAGRRGRGGLAGGPAPGLASSAADVFCPRNVAHARHAGIHLGEMWDMEELAKDCPEDGV